MINVRIPRWLLTVSCLLALAAPESAAEDPPQGPQRWEQAIQRFEQSDQQQPVTPGGLLFVGSSSIRLWDLDKSFPNRGYLNRGFGGAQTSDILHFAPEVIIR